MAKQEEKYTRRRLRSAYITTIVSITLVLLLMGVLGVLVIHAGAIATYVRENIIITLVMEDEASSGQVMAFQKQLDATPFVRSTRFVSKEQAASDLQEELGEEFLAFLGYNPIPTTLDLFLKAGYTHPDSLNIMVAHLQNDPLVAEVKYQKSLAEKIQDNIGKISLVLLGFSALLLLVSIILIHNTIRLSVYARRFLIRTMYLIGATRRFILWPFVRTSIIQGLVAAMFGIGLTGIALIRVYARFPELYATGSENTFLLLGAFLLLISLIISSFSTLLAVNKYLRIKKEKLY
ncbi:MAG: permease-like cell division protein FtsX [Bacteroidales bacterium]|nr:permease-like cell division protein FtsX [Bacteroidales bacterium]MDD3962018.1 permease-like cell division protein FtsX [Bacteroidales bacterium]